MTTQKVINFPETEKEIWKPISGYEGFYEVSTKGRVRSVDRIIKYRGHNQYAEYEIERPLKGKILSPGNNGKGYLQVNLSKKNGRNVVCVHRLIAESFIPNPKDKRTVNHKDGDKKNNNVDNLEWVSYSENHAHAYNNGLRARGKNHHYSSLEEKDIRDIRKSYAGDARGGRKYKKGKTSKELADEYNVSRAHINSIVRYRKWKHVK